MLFKYPCQSPIKCYPIDITLNRGSYLIECYGASGGDTERSIGGYGAYVSGVIKLKRETQFFLFIGSKGHLIRGEQAFNGGGRPHILANSESHGASGGGSTDIRLINSSDKKGLLSRIIVAGAGGGSEAYVNGVKGGNGMFFEGESGSKGYKNTVNSIKLPTGGTSTKGGEAGTCLINGNSGCPTTYNAHPGGFGYGGDASDDNYGAGGGSGYFGGGGAGYTSGIVASGAGGSSYISGQKGCHSFIEDSSGNIIDSNSEIHSSGFYFTRIRYKNGNETLYSDNGKIIITVLQRCTLDSTNSRLLKITKCITILLISLK